MKKFLVTGSTGVTGTPTVRLLLENGHKVMAFVRREDVRSEAMKELGAEIVTGDMLKIEDVRRAMKGVDGVYFCYPLTQGAVEATAILAQAATEHSVKQIVYMSHRQSRPHARSPATMSHWLSEQILDRSGIPTAHLRVNFFAEWILYTAAEIRAGRYLTPFDPESRFVPIAAVDIARVVGKILENPEAFGRTIIPVTGSVEVSHIELTGILARTLGKEIRFEQVSPDEFVKAIGLDGDPSFAAHFKAVKVDQQEQLLAGVDKSAAEIVGQPLTTPEQFIEEHRHLLA
ncbi:MULTISPECIES: NmrA family NAD(P)-binding protein [Cupriavidus]|uniref:NAD-dependent epimerase/dehydratase family protein n=1 Tax=Cupriavidus oxalaticus TaxID=96344 RepID=A0A4P7L493_9BURK|nr:MULTISPECIES: NmrA family NAD(P)-binding protein [Cupriavidus]MBF6986174.1 NmrA family NAD(P)-binding protein [Cupriavidus sp. IK-TO18]QBY50318.1 NAD-dependent epimerase/dehydratase family protein [Cupriavidus oxalaticus]